MKKEVSEDGSRKDFKQDTSDKQEARKIPISIEMTGSGNPYLFLKSVHEVYLLAKNGKLGEMIGKYNSYISMNDSSLVISAGQFHLEIPFEDIDSAEKIELKSFVRFSALGICTYSVDGAHIVGEYKNRRWGRFYCCIDSFQKSLIKLDYGNGKRLIFNDIDTDFMNEMYEFLCGISYTKLNTQ